jgi:hypothetical protein
MASEKRLPQSALRSTEEDTEKLSAVDEPLKPEPMKPEPMKPEPNLCEQLC